VLLQVGLRRVEQLRTVAQITKRQIAGAAEEAANNAGRVTVVDVRELAHRTAADRAESPLVSQHRLVLVDGETVLPTKN